MKFTKFVLLSVFGVVLATIQVYTYFINVLSKGNSILYIGILHQLKSRNH